MNFPVDGSGLTADSGLVTVDGFSTPDTTGPIFPAPYSYPGVKRELVYSTLAKRLGSGLGITVYRKRLELSKFDVGASPLGMLMLSTDDRYVIKKYAPARYFDRCQFIVGISQRTQDFNHVPATPILNLRDALDAALVKDSPDMQQCTLGGIVDYVHITRTIYHESLQGTTWTGFECVLEFLYTPPVPGSVQVPQAFNISASPRSGGVSATYPGTPAETIYSALASTIATGLGLTGGIYRKRLELSKFDSGNGPIGMLMLSNNDRYTIKKYSSARYLDRAQFILGIPQRTQDFNYVPATPILNLRDALDAALLKDSPDMQQCTLGGIVDYVHVMHTIYHESLQGTTWTGFECILELLYTPVNFA